MHTTAASRSVQKFQVLSCDVGSHFFAYFLLPYHPSRMLKMKVDSTCAKLGQKLIEGVFRTVINLYTKPFPGGSIGKASRGKPLIGALRVRVPHGEES